MENLKITIIQQDIYWEDKEKNLAMFEKKIDGIKKGETDLIILPEMFLTGFSMNAQNLYEDMNGKTVEWLVKKSAEKKADITGSLIIKESGKFFNRLIWAKPDGSIFKYDKKHLFQMADEHKTFTKGEWRIIVESNGWKIMPFICYDLRFPFWCRNLSNEYDIAVFIASWPKARSSHWRILLAARAVENQCYVIGVNRVGKDGNDREYDGSSLIIDPLGKTLFDAKDKKSVHYQELFYEILEKYRKNFPAWMDADFDMAEAHGNRTHPGRC
jgi:omega-amidase